jgi:hypothetical protein
MFICLILLQIHSATLVTLSSQVWSCIYHTLSRSNLYVHLDFLLYACCFTIMFWYVLQDDFYCMFIASQSCFVILQKMKFFNLNLTISKFWWFFFQNFNKMTLIYIKKTQNFKKKSKFLVKKIRKTYSTKTIDTKCEVTPCWMCMLHFTFYSC